MYKEKIYILSSFEMAKLQKKLFDAYLNIAESLDNDYLSIDFEDEKKAMQSGRTISPKKLEKMF